MRCFVAIELPGPTQHSLRSLQQELDALLAAGGCGRTMRWTAPESIHLTLRFLGETSPAQEAHIGAGMRAAASNAAPLTLTLQGIGCFPNSRRPNVVWAGVAGDPAALESLRALQATLEQAARAAGFAPEERPFTPHLTLGRARREAEPADLARTGALLKQAAQSPAVLAWSTPLAITGVSLMHSDLRPTGAVYTALDRAPLGAA